MKRRAVLASTAALYAGVARAESTPRVRITTELGSFVVEVYPDRAPLTAGVFLAHVDQHLLDGALVYRIVTRANQPPTVPARIEVVQFGLPTPQLPPVAHEPTSQTGLRHRDGTLSLARLAPGTGSSAYFICIGDQPELDFAGKRNPDGQGFAAFGQVMEGMDVVRRLFARGEAKDVMERPVPINRVERVP